MRTIAEQIKAGRTAEELGLSAQEYQARKELITEFLRSQKWDSQAFMLWLLSRKDLIIAGGEFLDSRIWQRKEQPKPTLPEKAAGFVKSAGEILASGGRFADDATYESRLALCKECRQFTGKRCTQCGCFMDIKAKFAAMRCPLGLW